MSTTWCYILGLSRKREYSYVMATPTSEQVRQALGDLIVAVYGDFTAAAKDLPYPYKTLWKNFSDPENLDRTKTVTLDLVMGVYAELRKRNPKIPDFVLFLSMIASGQRVDEFL